MKRFENKNILITGSTQGIGAACALRLAKEGANIILNGRHFDDEVQALIDEIKALGQEVKFVQQDVSKFNHSVSLVNEAIAAFGSLDILINNAGVERSANFWDITEAEYDLVMDTNLKGVFFLLKRLLNIVKHNNGQVWLLI